MKLRISVLMIIVLAAVALSLSACGSGGGFEGRVARDASETSEYLTQAIDLAKSREAAVADVAEETALMDPVAEKFKSANEAYKSGDYAQAATLYQEVIEGHPRHFGANVNLSLAMLQEGKADDAFTQALTCAALFPDEGGALLNAQIAGVTCGFSAATVEDTIKKLFQEREKGSFESAIANSAVEKSYRYNKIWDAIEVDLQPGAAGQDASSAYSELDSQLTDLVHQDEVDTDIAALNAYLHAVGSQLGYLEESSTASSAGQHAQAFRALDTSAVRER